MNESERLQRWRDNYEREKFGKHALLNDEKISTRISALLNHPQIDMHCMVDAYYYDFSVIPDQIQEKFQLWRDAYMIYGITTEGEMITKWVDRYDLDSHDQIVDGKVILSEQKSTNFIVPEIRQLYNPKLLATPSPEIFKGFKE